MANLRTGAFGSYYGSFYNESESLSQAEMQTNATYIYSYLINRGWSLNAIAAILGNMQAESALNPGRWQGDNIGVGPAYGLVQWDHFSKYTEWCTAQGFSDPSEMDNNLARIIYELNNNIQWYATDTYNLSFKEFSTSNLSVTYLAGAFVLNYERPADQSESVQQYRGSLASNWYSFLTGTTPNPENPGTGGTYAKYNKKFNFLLLNSRKRSNQWTNKRF
jgi:hypothetical protein